MRKMGVSGNLEREGRRRVVIRRDEGGGKEKSCNMKGGGREAI